MNLTKPIFSPPKSLKFEWQPWQFIIISCLNTTKKERGKDLPSSIQARDEVVFFKFAKKMMILVEKMEKTWRGERKTNFLVWFDEREE